MASKEVEGGESQQIQPLVINDLDFSVADPRRGFQGLEPRPHPLSSENFASKKKK